MVELLRLLSGLLHQPPDAGLDPLKLRVWNPDGLQLLINGGFYGFRHEKSGLLEGVELGSGFGAEQTALRGVREVAGQPSPGRKMAAATAAGGGVAVRRSYVVRGLDGPS
jgi:hypothetical protein